MDSGVAWAIASVAETSGTRDRAEETRCSSAAAQGSPRALPAFFRLLNLTYQQKRRTKNPERQHCERSQVLVARQLRPRPCPGPALNTLGPAPSVRCRRKYRIRELCAPMRRVRGRADEDATAAGTWETKVKWKHQLGIVLGKNYPIW
ncbi:uncharacterized protein LOC116479334 [Hylobates moloch]|uniref:uncharacterized protein LOC116479334 n=1 Tax=Hylobates moloch TaxID=81572 RepID=UPI002675E28B|nr:uncharacterized protein LOC116479334 [Hylobates moloch]